VHREGGRGCASSVLKKGAKGGKDAPCCLRTRKKSKREGSRRHLAREKKGGKRGGQMFTINERRGREYSALREGKEGEKRNFYVE